MDDKLRNLHREYLRGTQEGFEKYNQARKRAGLDPVMPLHIAEAIIVEWPKKKPKSKFVDGVEVWGREPKQAEKIKIDEARQVCLVYYELSGWRPKLPRMFYRHKPKAYFIDDEGQAFLPEGFPAERNTETLPYYSLLSPNGDRYAFFAGTTIHQGLWYSNFEESTWDVSESHTQTVAYNLFSMANQAIHGR